MPTSTESQDYNSIFDPGIKTDVYNFIAEFLIKTKLEVGKKNLPKSPFWRKEYQTNEYLKWLGQLYQDELTEIKKLGKVFSPKVILEVIRAKKIITIRYLKIDQRKDLIYNLFLSEIKNQNEIKKEKSKVVVETCEGVAAKQKKGSLFSL